MSSTGLANRELNCMTNSTPRLGHPMEVDNEKAAGNLHWHSPRSSYNTFVPQYAIDSEFLKTLLVGRFLPCQLSEPSSYQSSFVNGGLNVNINTSDSGIHSADSESPSPPHSADKPDFFHECEQQLFKLFEFVERNLSSVESDLQALMDHTNVSNVRWTESEEEEVGEKTPLTGNIQEEPVNAALLTHLEQVLISLKESISTSFTHLDRLI